MTKTPTALAITACALAAALPARATDIDTDTAVLRALDKVSARVMTIKVAVGQPARFGRLSIVARRCVTHPPEETPESAAFLEIDRSGPEGQREPVFKGWMFASSPDLSAMDDAVYDVWVLACEDSSASRSSGASGP
jgi:hypothetical protein